MLNGGNKDENNATKQPMFMSFRDKVLGSEPVVTRKRVDLVATKLAQVEHIKGNRLLPMLHVQETVIEELSLPYKGCLVVKLLGKTIGYNMMKTKLETVWKLNGGFDLMEVGNSFFMVKFDEEDDKTKVINEGPWMIFDHYLALRQWSPTFNAATATIDKTMAWIRIPNLNLVYYDESVLWAVASMVGTPVKVDMHTLRVARGKFARLCVEIDLTKPVVGRVGINGEWYNVQYEGLHIICTQCGCYGHILKDCTAQRKTATDAAEVASTPITAAPEVPTETVTSNNGKEINAENGHGGISGDIIKDILNKTDSLGINGEPDSMHGEWIKVERRKRNNKANNIGGFGGDNNKVKYQKLRNRINELNQINADFSHENRGRFISTESNNQRDASARIWKNKQKRSRGDIGPSNTNTIKGNPMKDTNTVGVYKGGYTAVINKGTTKAYNVASNGPLAKNIANKDSLQSKQSETELILGDGTCNILNVSTKGEASQKSAIIPPQQEDRNMCDIPNESKEDQGTIINKMDAEDRNTGKSYDTQMQIN
jgi:hypothetical protein